MPLQEPVIDDRGYREILSEALARIPVHNPEWTNFNDSDPGVTLLQLFSFLTESLLYRSNRIPEKNRLRFLKLLGIGLEPAAAARGLVGFGSPRGPLEARVLDEDLELLAGDVPFRTESGLAVLPVEGRLFYKAPLSESRRAEVEDLYTELFASLDQTVAELAFYETAELVAPASGVELEGVDLNRDTVDGSLWLALLARAPEVVTATRQALADQVLTLGVVPLAYQGAKAIPPQGREEGERPGLTFWLPEPTPRDDLGNAGERLARYRLIDARTSGDVLAEPGLVEVPLSGSLELWDDLEPTDKGAGEFPPSLADDVLRDRVVTWVRIRVATPDTPTASGRVAAQVGWVELNAAEVRQRLRAVGELLGDGNGEPEQSFTLANTPVIPGTVQLTVGGERWHEISDLSLAGPEVEVTDSRAAPGSAASLKSGVSQKSDKSDLSDLSDTSDLSGIAKVFTVDRESGEVRFGDGLRGHRPALRAVIQATYEYGGGRRGQVGVGAVNRGSALPAGLRVRNPVPTWGGAEAETAAEAERRIPQVLRHRHRLVSAEDFLDVTRQTPGVDLGRVEVLPLFHPELGDAPAEGVVTVMVVPRYDPRQPEAPRPDDLFLDTVCRHLLPRRLVTTEVWVSGPRYVPLVLSVGIEVVPGVATAPVREAVRREIQRFLSPLEGGRDGTGWPLGKPVEALEIWAMVASRVPDVSKVVGVALGDSTGTSRERITVANLELPRLTALSVREGEPLDLEDLVGSSTSALPSDDGSAPRQLVPVPVVPPEC